MNNLDGRNTIETLLVICPTRGRPQECARMIDSFDKKSTKEAKLVLIVDADDPCLTEYEHIFKYRKHSYCTRHKESVTYMINIMATCWLKDFQYYSIICDDYIYHTGSWDYILINKLIENGGGFAFGDDGFGHDALPTTCVISGSIIQALGWIVLPELKCLCGDLVWREIGQKLNRLFYVPEVKIEHMTSLAGKAEPDDTFYRTNSDENYTNDNKTFRTWRSNNLKADIAKIRKALNG